MYYIYKTFCFSFYLFLSANKRTETKFKRGENKHQNKKLYIFIQTDTKIKADNITIGTRIDVTFGVKNNEKKVKCRKQTKYFS